MLQYVYTPPPLRKWYFAVFFVSLLQPMWKSVEDLSPDVWLWIGDAVYVDKFSDGGVGKVITIQQCRPLYSAG